MGPHNVSLEGPMGVSYFFLAGFADFFLAAAF
ncbi:MAG: hypothetical protein A4E57_00828 [Syntrophorhabdaceae bacterium PtaU1.Bin034]|nr:MAG: hypothetical protein A4E57_00828 [Syntrophorhabdaceae bacterium PtaU1.Bin034]